MLSLGSLEKEQIPQHHCESSAATVAVATTTPTPAGAAVAAAAATAVCLETLGDVKDMLEMGFKILQKDVYMRGTNNSNDGSHT